MKPTIKLAIAILILLLYFALFCIVWLEQAYLQLGVLIIVVVGGCVAFSFSGMLKRLLFLAPFFLFLAFTYLVLAWAGFGKTPAYWLHYGITRTLLLLSSLLLMQLLVVWIKLDDFLDLPLDISKTKYIILGKILYRDATVSYQELCVFGSFIPSNQALKLSMKRKFQLRIATVLALISYIIHEANLKGEMIDARIRLCYGSEKQPLQKKPGGSDARD